jgi:hypothetical protein
MKYLFILLLISITSCTSYRIRVVEYDGTGYSLYIPMKRYGLDTWRDENIIYYSEEMAKYKIDKWKSGEHYLNPWKTPQYIKIK